MTKYEKVYTRENCLLAFNMWEEHQTSRNRKILGWVTATSIFNVTESVGECYYSTNVYCDGSFGGFEKAIREKLKESRDFIQKTMHWYEKILEPLQKVWKENKPLKDVNALLKFYDTGVDAWCGLDVSYCVPAMKDIDEKDKLRAMEMREKAVAFLEDMDRIFQKTLFFLFPKLNDLSKYIAVDEIKTNKIPTKNILEERKKHYIYFNNKIITNISFDNFLKQNKIEVERIVVNETGEIKGQIAMKGIVKGRVIIILKKEKIKDILPGEILVTAMTTPDYLPAMQKAVAFVTDEGGITCHAAIVARELKKPCVIGTKIATKVFKDGDLVEVDANKGVVRKIK